MVDFKQRVEKLQKKMKVDCVILAQFNHPEADSYYYSGVTEPFLAYVGKEKSVAFTDADEHGSQFDEVLPLKKAKGSYNVFFKKNKVKTVGMNFSTEANRVGFKLLEGGKIKAKDYSDEFDALRSRKDEQEQRLIRKAQEMTKKTVEEAKQGGFEGKTENELAGFLEFSCRKKGFALDSFPPIVATGENAATPHAIPSNDKVKETVLIDCGATCKLYHADYTTTEYWGKGKEMKDAVEAVWEAKKAAERKAKVGTSGKTISNIAEKVIAEYGFGAHSFRKARLSLGHSVGLKVHDGFRVDDVKLEKGMVFTIEPGIYVPKRFGVRFEDVVFL
ncbi:MAG TPA: M24 family metallopeptidase [Candidatus Norongarragalinales archaeon]|nr:M24 family metallopeptidase [Candidatus Norongarragalinales archaeon]